LFACGPADATAIPKLRHFLPQLHPDWFYLLVPAYSGCPGKEAIKRCSGSGRGSVGYLLAGQWLVYYTDRPPLSAA